MIEKVANKGNILTMLKRIVQEVTQIPQLDIALFKLASRVKNTMGVDSCSIYLADYDSQEFVLKATDGLDPQAVEQVRIGLKEGGQGPGGERAQGLVGWAAGTRPVGNHRQASGAALIAGRQHHVLHEAGGGADVDGAGPVPYTPLTLPTSAPG